MPDENDDAREWVVDPPRPGEILLQLNMGEGAELTAEQETAVYALIRSLEGEDAEVVGLAKDPTCPRLVVCNGKKCPPLDCAVLRCTLTAVQSTGISFMGSFGLA
jgi:hypothetical protein